MWLMILPLYFYSTVGLWSILVCAAISLALLGIEAIGEGDLNHDSSIRSMTEEPLIYSLSSLS